MVGAAMLGAGGSEYVALEAAIGLAKNGFDACIDPIILRYFAKAPRSMLDRIVKFYGIPSSDARLLRVCDESPDDSIVINVSGDLFSGFGHIIYFHFPSHMRPETYYPSLPFYMKAPSYIYYAINRL
jgi:hypothetical protein